MFFVYIVIARLINTIDLCILIYPVISGFYFLILRGPFWFGGFSSSFFLLYNHGIWKHKDFSFILIYVYFFCPFLLARSSSTVFNKSGQSRCPCLVPSLKGKVVLVSVIQRNRTKRKHTNMDHIQIYYEKLAPMILQVKKSHNGYQESP